MRQLDEGDQLLHGLAHGGTKQQPEAQAVWECKCATECLDLLCSKAVPMCCWQLETEWFGIAPETVVNELVAVDLAVVHQRANQNQQEGQDHLVALESKTCGLHAELQGSASSMGAPERPSATVSSSPLM